LSVSRRPVSTRWRLALTIGVAAGLLSACSYAVPTLTAGPIGTDRDSVVLAADGTVLATLHGAVDRRPVPLSSVPLVLQQAVVTTEDQRFWTEPAIDVRALIRAGLADLRAGRAAQGASTIPEQYVKLVLAGQDDQRRLSDKVREATLAYELERHHSRSQILSLYLNTVYLGAGAYGVEAASETYFGVPVANIDLAQAALLAGAIHAPSDDDPLIHPVAAQLRRTFVLSRLRQLDQITPSQEELAGSEPLLPPHPSRGRNTAVAPYFVDDVENFVLADPTFGATPEAREARLFGGGLVIHTTLDPSQEADAEQAVGRVLPARGPAGAVVSLDPASGAVEALVGGEAYQSGLPGSQLDLATQSQRPSGSTFKPFVLTTALEHGIGLGREFYAPATMSIPVTGGLWTVRNYEGEPTGTMNLVEATIVSDNVVFAQLMMAAGPQRVITLAASLGLTTPLEANPSAVLGTNPVNPLEMADAYATIIDGGIHNSPFMVREVDGPGGVVVYRHQSDSKRMLPAAVAYAVDGVLQQVVDQGTGVEARIGRPVAGKTGTTDNWADAWFVGGTPQLVSAVWVGYPSAETPMVPPATPFHITGGTWPARVFQLFASAALSSTPVVDFPKPPSDAAAAIDGPVGITVDNVVGYPVAEATTQLGDDGFVVTSTTVANGEYPPGYVVGESPPGGTSAPGGSTVVLQVSH
jgi:penicillin-binding protein 1A